MEPKCPKCQSETITMTITGTSVYEIHSMGYEEFEGKDVLLPDDYDLIDTDETSATIYSCTECEFKSENLEDFKPE